MSKSSEVCVVGAGPAGLMMGALMARYGIKTQVLDERPDQTTVGRADGIQPKTIETFQMMGLGDDLLRDGVRVFDICMWRGDAKTPMHRVSREVHYPEDALDVLHPFILLCHQGMIEGILVDDLRDSGIEVERSHIFEKFEQQADKSLKLSLSTPPNTTITTDYVIGCDGARSKVRANIPESSAKGSPHRSVWGVLDGELDTDFPDIWSKTVVYSAEHGTVLIIPRERNMTRFYIEMKDSESSSGLGQEFVMDQARRVLSPYKLNWTRVEWFGNYQVAQRVADKFADPTLHAFIAGDASHTHSPKAAQGMNTSVHDSWNLAWKLNLFIRGLAKPDLLQTYEQERQKIGHDLINFDYEHANSIAAGDAQALADNFRTNIRFIAGVGAEYAPNLLNVGHELVPKGAEAHPGLTLPPAKATRYVDANPLDLQLAIPLLGQFRVFVVVPDIVGSAGKQFLADLSAAVTAPSSLISKLSVAAAASYKSKPRPERKKDCYVRPERYTSVNELFTFALLTSTDKNKFEISQLPPLFSHSPWTVFLDDVAHLDSRNKSATTKWLGAELRDGEAAIISVRPDGYMGALGRWKVGQSGSAKAAADWLDSYYGGFLKA